ncbi:MAG: FAD-dependent oxidoreductase [Chloroflexi bacterium]|nr:FAD-dependent oxidoreductase [Chloroflexota bacterium]
MFDLMIIGGGPAGLAASVYAARKRLDTLLIATDIGGQVIRTMGIENYLGYQFIEGPELIEKFRTQISQFPIEQKIGYTVTRLTKVDTAFQAETDSSEKFQARAVIYATGKKPRKLGVPGEDEYAGKGVTYCAICDGPVFAGQRVAVVGGGNSALSAALDMVKIAEHVDLVSLTKLTGDAILIDKLSEARNLNILTEYQTEKIEGNSLVTGMRVRGVKSGEEKRLDLAGVFVEIGLVPNSEAVKDLVKLNRFGEVKINCRCETPVPGLYAAGDVTDVPEKQIVIAAGEGAKAALQAHRYLQRLAYVHY